MRSCLALCFALLFLAGAALAEGPAPPPREPTADGGTRRVEPLPAPVIAVEPQQQFVLPSGNIGCVYTPAGGTDVYRPADGGPELACDRIEPVYVRAILSSTGRGRMDEAPGDQGCCAAGPVLGYGEVWRAGPFSCLSERTGLTCSRADGHGFFLSRRRIGAS
ncbi:DUF6636 domain-containing protein [Ensifer soli]|uniref:DUF6636 domain-containing protein n=1 Tax=Ciceribacter sp. sgz301302 TaxID=3342379 RepID=UPI0035BA501D